MATSFQVTFDCTNPHKLSRFWAAALGYEIEDAPQGYATWDDFLSARGIPEEERDSGSSIVDPDGKGPRIFFQRVPEPKAAKNRVHLDVGASDGSNAPLERRRERVDEEAERLAKAGATALRAFDEYGGYWVVMQDPEGNEFCLS